MSDTGRPGPDRPAGDAADLAVEPADAARRAAARHRWRPRSAQQPAGSRRRSRRRDARAVAAGTGEEPPTTSRVAPGAG